MSIPVSETFKNWGGGGEEEYRKAQTGLLH